MTLLSPLVSIDGWHDNKIRELPKVLFASVFIRSGFPSQGPASQTLCRWLTCSPLLWCLSASPADESKSSRVQPKPPLPSPHRSHSANCCTTKTSINHDCVSFSLLVSTNTAHSFTAMSLLRSTPATQRGLSFTSTTSSSSSSAFLLRRGFNTTPRLPASHPAASASQSYIKGTVNDPTTYPPPNPAHGHQHWAFERALSVALLPLTALAVAKHGSSGLLDGALGLSLIVHSHIGAFH